MVRKHWVIDFKIFLTMMIVYVIPGMLLVSAILVYWPNFFNNFRSIIMVYTLIYLLFAGLVLYIKWLNEELDLIVVTNLRVISLDQVKFMERTVSETGLTQIQDVKGIEKGVLSNILHYGDIEIQTAAEQIVFKIQNVPYPFRAARRILEMRDKLTKT